MGKACPVKSKVKLVIYFQDQGVARFFSIVKENKKAWEVISEKMAKRILGKKYSMNFKVAIFYDNNTDTEFKRIHGIHYTSPKENHDNFCPENSIVKATMIGLDHKAKVFYSRLEEEKQLGYDPIKIKTEISKRLKSKFDFIELNFEFRTPKTTKNHQLWNYQI